MADTARRFTRALRQKMGSEPYLIVSHSMGGIITRLALPHLLDTLPRHLIMLAPPNQPARIAGLVSGNPLYRLATGDCGKKLADESFYNSLPAPPVPTTIIAGTRGISGPRSPFGDEPNDTVLTVAETQLDIPGETILVPATHTFLMNSPRVADIVSEIANRNS